MSQEGLEGGWEVMLAGEWLGGLGGWYGDGLGWLAIAMVVEDSLRGEMDGG